MNKFLLSAFAMLFSLTVNAQSIGITAPKSQLDVKKELHTRKYMPVSAMQRSQTKASAADNQRYVGLYATDDCDKYMGATGWPGDNKAAILLFPDDYAPYYGSKVVGVRFNLAGNCSASDVFVSNLTDDGYLKEIACKEQAATTPEDKKGEWLTIMFDDDQQFELTTDYKYLLIGFSYKQTSDNNPFGLYSKVSGNLYVFADFDGNGENRWYNFGEKYGALSVQLIVENDNFATNALIPSDFGKFIVALGKTKDVTVNVTNGGTKLTDFDYTITQDGKTTEERHVDFDGDLGVGGSYSVVIPFEAASQVGEYPVELNITKVNGEKNQATSTTANGLNKTIAKEFKRVAVVEEFTGTGCGYCPRGHVGMHKMHEQFGDQFIGIALHQYNQKDPMFIADYTLNFHGAPSCYVNRGNTEMAPYSSAPIVVAEELKQLPLLNVSVSGTYNSDSTEVDVTASIESLTSGGDYEVAYMLIADGLTGTGSSWKQTNSYSGMHDYIDEEDLMFLADEPTQMDQVYNDVLIASSYKNFVNQATFDDLVENGITEGNYTLTMPTKDKLVKALDYKQIYVVAIVIDNETDEIVNAGKALVNGNTTGISSINHNNNVVIEACYAADGTKLSAPQKGINILKMSDGTTRKVMVK